MTGFYDQDLAHIHHTGFDDFVTGCTPGLLGAFHAAGFEKGTVVDLGCGGGIWLRALTEAGYDAVGVDISPALIDTARSTAPGASLHIGSAYDFAFPPCVAVTALSEVLSYCQDEAGPNPSPLFRKISAVLPPGGLFFFDVMTDGHGKPLRHQGWRKGSDWAVLYDVVEDGGFIRREITTFRKTGEGYRRTDERHVQKVYRRDDIECALRAAGFSVRALRHYGDYPLAPRRLAFRARKR